LVYFDFIGRAELIRLTLAAGSVPHKDTRIAFQQWGEMKAKVESPTGGLPILRLGDNEPIVVGQSTAIARYAAFRAGLAGKDAVGTAVAGMVVDNYWELLLSERGGKRNLPFCID